MFKNLNCHSQLFIRTKESINTHNRRLIVSGIQVIFFKAMQYFQPILRIDKLIKFKFRISKIWCFGLIKI